MILNLTQHMPTADQAAAGLLPPIDGAAALLNFDAPPTPAVLWNRAAALADIAAGQNPRRPAQVLIGGLPALMGPLEVALRDRALRPVYAHSARVSVEETLPDGSVRKVNTFRHVAFYEGAL